MRITEENFIRELEIKNEKALDYILNNYGWIIKGTVKKHLYNLEDYQGECINDILMAVWINIKSFDENKSEFKNWLGGIARYKCIDYKRKYIKTLQHDNIDNLNITTEDVIHKAATEKELELEVEELLSCLNGKDRELFIKLYVEEKTVDIISNETGYKKEVIYNRISRAKKKIKSVFNNVGRMI